MPWKDKAKIAAYKKFYISDPEKRKKATIRIAAWRKKKRAENPEKWREYDRKYYASRKDKMLLGWVKKKYRLTPEQYATMLEVADGKCDICDRPFGKKGPCIDHCHKTGVVRGVLCTRCNTAEGHLGTIEICEKLLAYMRKHEVRDDPREIDYGNQLV